MSVLFVYTCIIIVVDMYKNHCIMVESTGYTVCLYISYNAHHTFVLIFILITDPLERLKWKESLFISIYSHPHHVVVCVSSKAIASEEGEITIAQLLSACSQKWKPHW